ncbi:MAG: FAD-dependent oxidoreductase [Myxococcales bacterium]|jgi:glycerol-3-phosphate dehydrogenase
MPLALKRDIAALGSQQFDLCVVGGGITGVCVAHDAAARGLSVALLERWDFAAGTSSATTKLIHGGTRYLEHLELGLVREALHERRVLMRLAPHLVRVQPFMLPVYKGRKPSGAAIRTGMLLYDALSYDKNWDTPADKHMRWHRFMPLQEVVEVEPGVSTEGLRGASVYQDGQAPNPMRLCIEIAKTAAADGALLANYAPVTGLRIEEGRVTGVEALDQLTDQPFVVKAKLVVNCAGIWAVEVMKLLGKPPPVQLSPSKGIHLITRPLTRRFALAGFAPSGRRVMIVPWRGKSLVGVTDEFYDGPLDRIRPTAEEAKVLIEDVNGFLPSAKLTLADVEHAYAGARPLIHHPGKKASDLSRAYKLFDHASASGVPGMLSVVGGKLTTSRSLAEAVTDHAMKLLGKSARCTTEHLPIGGGDIGVVSEYLDRQREQVQGLVDEEVLTEFVHSYGSAYVDVVEYVRKEPRLGERIAAHLPFILAEVHYAAEHEMARTIADVALRRTDAGNLGDPGGRIGRAIGAELQKVLGLSDEQVESQLAAYLDQIAFDGLPGPGAAREQHG